MDQGARAFALFEAALEMEPAARDAFLSAECAGEAELLGRVRAMLLADGRAHAVLDGAPGRAMVGPAAPRPGDWHGRAVGPYRLVRELGRGGMGVVYLAERADVGARVAIKLLPAGLVTPELLARFGHERRLLARLEHPHIARFLDAGVAEDGTPWLAMEYVEGHRIDVHCDAHALGVRERLALVEQVGDAVAHAHLNLLVHRDLKPSNILVSEASGPKLVDFGIAKLVAGGDGDEGLTRDPAAAPMTPEYASPEQVRGDGITTASDVYQLGILLHELLTGRRPARAGGEPLRPFDRATCVQLARPSTLARSEVQPRQVASGPTDRTAHELSALRRASPRQLSRQLAGDLDAIIEQALRCDPRKRYGSARELVEDLRRHRRGLPVAARPASIAYRAASAIRRHTVIFTLAAALVLLVSGSAFGFWLQARRVTRERDRAERVSQVLERLLTWNDRAAGGSDSATAATVLRDVAQQGRANLAADPEAWGRILVIVGHVNEEMGQQDAAIALWRDVVRALEPAVPPGDSVLLDAMGRLGVGLVRRGEFGPGQRLLERALARARELSPTRRADLASRLYDAGFGRQIAGDDAAARRLYVEALGLLATLPDSGGPSYDRALVNLGYLADRQGDLAAAESHFRRALARRLARDGPAHDRTLNAKASLARTLTRTGGHAEADSLTRDALAGWRAMHQAPHPSLASILEIRATHLTATARPAEAEALAREALAMNRAVYGGEHFVVGHAETVVAGALAGQGRLAEAADLQRTGVARYRRTVGARHPGAVRALVRLAEYELALGRTAEAEALYREGIPPLDSITSGRPVVAPALARFGLLLAATARCAEAAPHLHRALALAPAAPPIDREWEGDARASLSRCLDGG